MKIICWNVNGIRAVSQKGFWDWLKTCDPDILCMQETKAYPGQLEPALVNPPGYTTYWAAADKKGYSGVSIWTKQKPLQVWTGLEIPEFDSEGRTLIAEFENFLLYNGYFPNGKDDLSRVPYKLKYSEAAKQFCLKLKKEKNKPVIVCGDVNTAHQEIDIARPKENEGSTGFLPEERAWVSSFIQAGFMDIYRALHPEDVVYSWWSFRSAARARNVGWRIDYFFITPELKEKIKASYYQPQVMGSDHCPVVLELFN